MPDLFEIQEGQSQPATAANENFTAVSPAGAYGKNFEDTIGLTFAYYGAQFLKAGSLHTIVGSTFALTDNVTNYLMRTASGTLVGTYSGFIPGMEPLYAITTVNSAISGAIVDYRQYSHPPNIGAEILSKMWPSDANYTLTAHEASARIIALSSGGLSTTRDLTVPSYGTWTVVNSTTGGQSVRVIANSVGITIATARAASVYAAGAGVVRISADVAPNA